MHCNFDHTFNADHTNELQMKGLLKKCSYELKFY